MNVFTLVPIIIKALQTAAALVPLVKADVEKVSAGADLKDKIREALKDLEEIAATLEKALAD